MKDNSKARKVLAEYRKLHGATACWCGDLDCKMGHAPEYLAEVSVLRAELKAQLAKLPNVPNKREASLLRQKAAKKGK